VRPASRGFTTPIATDAVQELPRVNTVAVVNQKGGVGKTTVTLGLASAALAAGASVLVVDLDPQASSTWVLGLDPADLDRTTAEVLGRSSAADAIRPSAWGAGVDVLPASGRLQAREHGAGSSKLRAALDAVAGSYDAVLVDCPPSLGGLTANALTAARHALMVVEPSALSLRGLGALADLVDEVWGGGNADLDLAGVIVNKVPPVSAEAERRYDELIRIVGKRAIWQPPVPQRVVVNQAIAERSPIHAYGARALDVSTAFDQLWRKLRRTLKA
jgi:cellulose biosynthesis protein BcsQ